MPDTTTSSASLPVTPTAISSPPVKVEIHGSSERLRKISLAFASDLAVLAAGAHGPLKLPEALRSAASHVPGAPQAAGRIQTDRIVATTGPSAAAPGEVSTAARTAPGGTDLERSVLAALSKPVPVETRGARAVAKLIDTDARPEQMSSTTPEQASVLGYAKFAPVVARVRNNETRQMENHWALHPWDVVRLCEETSQRYQKATGIKIEPKLLGSVLFAETQGVAQTGWDVAHKSKSFGIFQIDQQHSGANDPDPRANAMLAARMLTDVAMFQKQYPALSPEIAKSLVYNTSTKLRHELAQKTNLSVEDLPPATRAHVANSAYGAALYARAKTSYDQHQTEVARQHLPETVALKDAPPTRVNALRQNIVDAFLKKGVTPAEGKSAPAPTPTAAQPRDARAPAPLSTAPSNRGNAGTTRDPIASAELGVPSAPSGGSATSAAATWKSAVSAANSGRLPARAPRDADQRQGEPTTLPTLGHGTSANPAPRGSGVTSMRENASRTRAPAGLGASTPDASITSSDWARVALPKNAFARPAPGYATPALAERSAQPGVVVAPRDHAANARATTAEILQGQLAYGASADRMAQRPLVPADLAGQLQQWNAQMGHAARAVREGITRQAPDAVNMSQREAAGG